MRRVRRVERDGVVELRSRRSGRLLAKVLDRRWLEIKAHGSFELFDLAAYVGEPMHRRPEMDDRLDM